MAWDYNKLRGRIKEVFSTQEAFANALGISKSSLSQRLNSQLEFTQQEIFEACKLLNLPEQAITVYFFTPKV